MTSTKTYIFLMDKMEFSDDMCGPLYMKKKQVDLVKKSCG